jgi:hypothetical protein
MSSSVFDWRSGGSSLIYQELTKRGNRDGNTRRLRELEVLEKSEREARQSPRCDVFTSKSLGVWPQPRGIATHRPSAEQPEQASDRAPADRAD